MRNRAYLRFGMRLLLALSCVIIGIGLDSAWASRQTTAKKAERTEPREKSALDAEKPDGYLWHGVSLAEMRAFDPHFAARSQFFAAANLMFNRLVRIKPGTESEIEPDLAENIPEPKIIDGKQVWTFTLRRNVMFHRGPKTEPHPLSAEDVEFSLNKAIHQVNPIYSGDFRGMSVQKADYLTVRVIMEKPLTRLLLMTRLAQYPGGFIISQKAYQAQGYEGFREHPVGTGPFQFGGQAPGKKVTFVKNPGYFRGEPQLDGVEFLLLPEIADREAGMASGRLDIIDGVHDIAWLAKWTNSPSLMLDFSGMGEAAMLHFNTQFKPLNDPRIRKAIAYALDRNEFQERFGASMITNIYSPIPAEFVVGGLEKSEISFLELDYALDLNRARRMLTEAGYPDGFSMTLATSEMPVYAHYYQCLSQQLARVGINCKLDVVRHPAMHVHIRKSLNPVVIYIAWRPDADAILTRFFHSDSIMVTGAHPDTNFSHYQNLDKLIEAARMATDPDKQLKLWKYAQIKVLDDMVVYPLHYLAPVHLRKKNIDFGQSPTSQAIFPPISEATRIIP